MSSDFVLHTILVPVGTSSYTALSIEIQSLSGRRMELWNSKHKTKPKLLTKTENEINQQSYLRPLLALRSPYFSKANEANQK